MDLKELLGGALGQEATQLISKQLGIDANQAQSAVNLALPTILNALNRNTATEEGASALTNAISNDHNGAGLADLVGLAQNALGGDGASIIKHILGGSEQNVTTAVSENAGIGSGQASKVLQILAPIILNALGKQSKQTDGGINISTIASLLSNFAGNQQQQAPQHQDLISKILDRNNDGNISDDAMRIGGDLLKKFFK